MIASPSRQLYLDLLVKSEKTPLEESQSASSMSFSDVIKGVKNYILYSLIVLLYFIGLVIGRIGSIFSDVICWCSRKLGWKSFLNFASYSNYIKVESKDDKGRIRNLVMISNMYRTFASLSFCLICTIVFDVMWHSVSINDNCRILAIIIFLSFLVILFAFSYRKQATYITKRIFAVLENEGRESRNG